MCLLQGVHSRIKVLNLQLLAPAPALQTIAILQFKMFTLLNFLFKLLPYCNLKCSLHFLYNFSNKLYMKCSSLINYQSYQWDLCNSCGILYFLRFFKLLYLAQRTHRSSNSFNFYFKVLLKCIFSYNRTAGQRFIIHEFNNVQLLAWNVVGIFMMWKFPQFEEEVFEWE